MPTVHTSGAVKVAGISTANHDTASSSIGTMRDALVDVGWMVDAVYPASTTVGFPFGAPWWAGPGTGSGVNTGNGWVIGVFAFALGGGGGIGDGGYYWYNGAEGQPAPPGVAIQIGATAEESLGALVAAVNSDPHWTAGYGGGTLTIIARTPGHLFNNYEWTGNGVWSPPISSTFGGGYRLVSQAPHNNTAFSVKIVTQYQLLMQLTFPELDDYAEVVARSNPMTFWCDPFGFAAWEGDWSLSALAPYLRSGSAGPCLLYLSGSRPPLNNADGVVTKRALLAGTVCTAPQWAWYLPRALGSQHELVTTTNKPLLVDSLLAIGPAFATEERIVGWVYDSLVSTGAVGMGSTGELSGANWLSWRCNDGDGSGSLLATVWLHDDNVS